MVKRILTIAIVLAALAGCQQGLMRAPTVVSAGEIDPFTRVVPEFQTTEAPVFVVSGRTVSGHTDPARYYTNKRSRTLRLGLATAQIGPGMTWEELRDVSRVDKRPKNPPVVLRSYEEYGPMWQTVWPPDLRFYPDWDATGVDRGPTDRFIEAIEAQLAMSRERQITIFVHGFNTKFANNVKLAAGFWHFMARDDVLINFDWPSEGNVFSYHVDKANAQFATWQLRKLLQVLADETKAKQINILAHSAGNGVAVEAVRQLSLLHHELSDEEVRRRTRIGHVVLAAPDVDLELSVSAAIDGAGRVTQGWIVYASRRDKALGISGGIFQNVRLGASIGKLSEGDRDALIASDRPWIDVTPAQKRTSSFLGHSYYHQNPWISSDMMIFLRTGASPEERGLIRDMETGFLTFPDDYEARLPEIVERLRATYDLRTEDAE